MTAVSPKDDLAGDDRAAGRDAGRGERLPRLLFVFALLVFAFFYGFLAGGLRIQPYGLIETAFKTISDLNEHWRNDFGMEPTRHLVEAAPGRQRLTVTDPARLAPGLRLVSGLFPDETALNGALLMNAEGEVLHRWPIDYAQLDPGGLSPRNVFLHGLAALPDGSLIVNFDAGNALARIGACGNVLWSHAGPYHHVIQPAWDGTFWTWLDPDESTSKEQSIVQADIETGRELRRISMLNDVIGAHEAYGPFGIWSRESEDELLLVGDTFHPNDVEPLSPALAAAFPQFAVGDLMISLRSLNMVAVLDGRTLEAKWWQVGPWHRQHDPDWLPNGRISVFDNRMSTPYSRIVETDPVTREVTTVFAGSPETPFYTWRRGKHQRLANGNTLIVEPEGGRVLEVAPEGTILWEFHNIFDETRNGVLNKASLLAEDFFQAGALDCGGAAGS